MVKEDVVFTVDKKPVTLRPRPAIIGSKKNAELKAALP
jgi:hypothetical protein